MWLMLLLRIDMLAMKCGNSELFQYYAHSRIADGIAVSKLLLSYEYLALTVVCCTSGLHRNCLSVWCSHMGLIPDGIANRAACMSFLLDTASWYTSSVGFKYESERTERTQASRIQRAKQQQHHNDHELSVTQIPATKLTQKLQAPPMNKFEV